MRVATRKQLPVKVFHISDVLTAGQRVYIPAQCTAHTEHGERQASRGALSDVWRRPETSCSFRSPPPEHVCWNSPPIKTGISQVRCGNQASVGKHSGDSRVLSSAALGPHAASLPRPSRHSHPYCTSSLSHPGFGLFSTLFFSFFNTTTSARFCKIYFCILQCHL